MIITSDIIIIITSGTLIKRVIKENSGLEVIPILFIPANKNITVGITPIKSAEEIKETLYTFLLFSYLPINKYETAAKQTQKSATQKAGIESLPKKFPIYCKTLGIAYFIYFSQQRSIRVSS